MTSLAIDLISGVGECAYVGLVVSCTGCSSDCDDLVSYSQIPMLERLGVLEIGQSSRVCCALRICFLLGWNYDCFQLELWSQGRVTFMNINKFASINITR